MLTGVPRAPGGGAGGESLDGAADRQFGDLLGIITLDPRYWILNLLMRWDRRCSPQEQSEYPFLYPNSAPKTLV